MDAFSPPSVCHPPQPSSFPPAASAGRPRTPGLLRRRVSLARRAPAKPAGPTSSESWPAGSRTPRTLGLRTTASRTASCAAAARGQASVQGTSGLKGYFWTRAVPSDVARGAWRTRVAGRGRVVVRAGGSWGSSRRDRGWGGESDSEAEEDPSVLLQRRLVEQVRVQIGEAQVGRVVDESQQHLRDAVHGDMGTQLNRIARRAMKGADDFSERVLKQLDASAQAIERDLTLARKEMEAREREFVQFQRRVHESSNEGMFFKSSSTPYTPRSSRASSRLPGTKTPGGSSSEHPGSEAAHSLASPRRPRPASGVQRLGSANNVPASVDLGLTWEEERLAAARDSPERTFKRVLYAGLSLTCVSFLWSFASALLDGHFMSSSKAAEYAAVFAGFVVIKQGFEANTPAVLSQETKESKLPASTSSKSKGTL